MAPPDGVDDAAAVIEKSVLDRINEWGTTFVTALHARPLQPLPLFLFTPTLLFSSYLNLSGYQTASSGLTAAWSGLYALLALRRPQAIRAKFSTRGFVRGSAIGLGAANAIAGGWVYATGDFKKDEQDRKARNRWGGGE